MLYLAQARDALMWDRDPVDLDEVRLRFDVELASIVRASKGGVKWDEAEVADGHKRRRMRKAFEKLIDLEAEAAKKSSKTTP